MLPSSASREGLVLQVGVKIVREEKEMKKFILITLVLVVLVALAGCRYKLYKESNIYSIERFSSFKGSFFLATGSFGNKTYYAYYKEDEGGLLLEKVDAEITTIYLRDDIEPKVEYYSNGWDHKYRVYVPTDTLYLEFDLNDKD
jgi:hypothetical protein